MIFVWRILAIVVVLEVPWAGWQVARSLSRAPVPNPNLSRLDDSTAADLSALREGLDESQAESWLELAEAYLAHGCHPEAELCFRRAAELDPASGRILYGWASALERLGQMQSSRQRYAQALALVSESHAQSCHYRIGRNFLREENVEEANAALQRSGDLPQALYLQAKNALRRGDISEATRLLDRLERQMPDAIQTIQLQAECHSALGRTEQAAEFISRLERVQERMDLNDQNMHIAMIATRYGMLRRLNQCSQLGDPGIAAECVLAAIPGHHQEYSFLPKAAELQLNAGNPAAALDLLQRAVQQGVLKPALLERIGDVHMSMHHVDEALDNWRRAILLGETATVHGKLAAVYEQRGDLEAARRHAALQLEATGVAAYRNDALDSAKSALQDAVMQNPASARSWFYLGEVYNAQGNRSNAQAAYQDCLKQDPNHGRALAALSRLRPGQSD